MTDHPQNASKIGSEGASHLADPLGRLVVTDKRVVFPVLGLPLEIQTNSDAVIRSCMRTFGPWHDLDRSLVKRGSPLIARIIVHPGGEANDLPASFIYRLHENRLLAAGSGVLSIANRNDDFALAFVTPEAVENDEWFYRNVLEGLSLFLVTRHDRIPVHASVLVNGKKAMAFTGPSGSGKSTLSYAM